MATPSLPSTGSIVDYLNSQGKDSSFSARKKLYNDSGLGDRLGDFVGGSNQNLALLSNLTKAAQPPATPVAAPIANPAGTYQQEQSNVQGGKETIYYPPGKTPNASLLFPGTQPSATNPNPNAPLASTLKTLLSFSPAVTTPSTPAFDANAVAAAGGQPYKPNDASGYGGMSIFTPPAPPAPQTPATDVVGGAAAGVTPPSTQTSVTTSQSNDTQTKDSLGISASDLYPDIFGDKSASNASEADLINEWLNSSEGQLFIDRQKLKGMDAETAALEAKQKLEATYASDKTTLENKLAENGLAFSGVRATEVKALADTLAASELGVDREFASKLLNANLDLRDAILKGVADISKQAADGRKEAIQQLNAVGYAVIGNKLVKTLAAQKEDRISANGGSGGSSGNKLTWSEATAHGLPLSLVGQSETDVIGSLYSSTPPEWFKQKAESEAKQSLTPETLNKLWAAASPVYLAGANESTNHAKATQYFSSTYDADAETVKAYADRVETYVNSGLSYADAISKVVSEIDAASG